MLLACNAANHIGWYVVFTFIGLYLLQPYIKAYQVKRSREIANDPKRVEILKRDMQYARLKKQKEIYLQKQNINENETNDKSE